MSEHERDVQGQPETEPDAQGRDRKAELLEEMQDEGAGHPTPSGSAGSSPTEADDGSAGAG
jgi:hypothetical protein